MRAEARARRSKIAHRDTHRIAGTALARDALVLAAIALGATWAARQEPSLPAAAICGVALALLPCKWLRIPPLARSLAVAILFWALQRLQPDGHLRPMALSAVATAAAYAGFTLARRLRFTVRRNSLHSPAGRWLGLDYAQPRLWLERMRRRIAPLPPMRILLSPSPHEARIRTGFAPTAHDIAFGEPGSAGDRDLFVPLTIDALLRCHASGPAEAAGWPIPSVDCIDTCNDKLRFHRRMCANGFSRWLPALARPGEFPSVLKKRIDEWGSSCHLLLEAGDEQRYADLLSDPLYFRQRYVAGEVEYAAHLLLSGGRIVDALTVEYRFGAPFHLKGTRDSPDCLRMARNGHLGLFRAMLASIGFEGLCCINYKMCDGRPLVLEVNPRFGASLAPFLACFVERALRAGVSRRSTTSGTRATGA